MDDQCSIDWCVCRGITEEVILCKYSRRAGVCQKQKLLSKCHLQVQLELAIKAKEAEAGSAGAGEAQEAGKAEEKGIRKEEKHAAFILDLGHSYLTLFWPACLPPHLSARSALPLARERRMQSDRSTIADKNGQSGD